MRLLGQHVVQPRRDREALIGEADGGLEQLRPGQTAMPGMGERQRPERAGHPHRLAADHRRHEGEGLAVGAEEAVRVCRRRRGLAAVEALHPVVRVRPIEDEGAAADAGGLRLHEVEHHLGGDCRVDGAAAGAQDRAAGLRRQRIGGRYHVQPGKRRARRGAALDWPILRASRHREADQQRSHAHQQVETWRREGQLWGGLHGRMGPPDRVVMPGQDAAGRSTIHRWSCLSTPFCGGHSKILPRGVS